MTYELGFWKQKRGTKFDPKDIYQRLSAGETVEGLDELPIDTILDQIRQSFTRGWTQLDEKRWEAPKKSFQIQTTPQFFRVDCTDMDGEEMNVFIELGLEYDCPLYDVSLGQRYD